MSEQEKSKLRALLDDVMRELGVSVVTIEVRLKLSQRLLAGALVVTE